MLSKIGFDTAENESLKVCQESGQSPDRVRLNIVRWQLGAAPDRVARSLGGEALCTVGPSGHLSSWQLSGFLLRFPIIGCEAETS